MKELRDGQLHMSKLTKQWFDEANKNNKVTDLNDEAKSKVTFKKTPSNSQNANVKLTVDNKTYHKLDPKNNVSSILLDSTDDDDDDDADDDVIIDKTKLAK